MRGSAFCIMAGGIFLSSLQFSYGQNVKTEAVFEIVDTTRMDEVVGIASLVDAELGILVTAGHLTTSPGNLMIKGGGKYKFNVLMQGDNVTNVLNDWAILKVEDTNWIDSLPRADLKLIYSYPDASRINHSSIMAGRRKSTFPNALEYESQINNYSCNENSVFLLEVNRYDRGDSGSPVFVSSNELNGVTAITSRFQSKNDQLTGSEKRLVHIFYDLTRNGPAAAVGLDEGILTTLIKDKVLVKVLPIKCILDGVAIQIRNRFEFAAAKNDLVERITKHLDRIKTTPRDSDMALRTAQFVAFLTSDDQDIRWVDIIRLWDAFFSTFNEGQYGRFVDAMAIYSAMITAAKQEQIDGVESVFQSQFASIEPRNEGEIESINRWNSDRPPVVEKEVNRNSKLHKFILRNRTWEVADGEPLDPFFAQVQVDVSTDARVDKGLQLVADLQDERIAKSLNPTARQIYTDLAISLISTTEFSDTNWDPGTANSIAKKRLAGIDTLIRLTLRDDAVKTQFSTWSESLLAQFDQALSPDAKIQPFQMGYVPDPVKQMVLNYEIDFANQSKTGMAPK